jgi:HD-GYP domain-containing protein (c-di-GMP phosphodiesterase class II)
LSGEAIPFEARILCVADVFDALTSERPYRKAFSAEHALQVMCEEMAGSFDPIILDTMVNLVESGKVDNIINRHTDPDEMYKIWARFRTSLTESPFDREHQPA